MVLETCWWFSPCSLFSPSISLKLTTTIITELLWKLTLINIEGGYFLELMNRYHIDENYSFGDKNTHSLTHSLENLETVDAHNKGNDFVDLIGTTNLSNLTIQFTRTEG